MTYTDSDLLLDGIDYLVDSTPLIFVLGTTPDDVETLQDVYDVIDASTLHSELPGALVQVEKALLRSSI